MTSLLRNDSVGFWGSGDGITLRLEMLGGAINTASYNNTLQVCAPMYGVQYFKMAGHSLNVNIASSIMGESIDKACLCPSFLHTQIAFTPGMFGFHGKKNQSSQRSGINTPNLNNSVSIALSNRILQK